MSGFADRKGAERIPFISGIVPKLHLPVVVIARVPVPFRTMAATLPGLDFSIPIHILSPPAMNEGDLAGTMAITTEITEEGLQVGSAAGLEVAPEFIGLFPCEVYPGVRYFFGISRSFALLWCTALRKDTYALLQ